MAILEVPTPQTCIFHTCYSPNFCMTGTQIPLNINVTLKNSANHALACGYKSLHPGGSNFVMGDGSVQFIKSEIDYRLYNALGSREYGDIVTLP